MKVKRMFIKLIILLFIISFSNCTYASRNITEMAKEWIQTGESDTGVFNTNADVGGFLQIAGLLKGIGIFVAVGTGIILGIKFMYSTAQGKAEILQLLIPYVIGVSIIVGALVIWKVAIGILDI